MKRATTAVMAAAIVLGLGGMNVAQAGDHRDGRGERHHADRDRGHLQAVHGDWREGRHRYKRHHRARKHHGYKGRHVRGPRWKHGHRVKRGYRAHRGRGHRHERRYTRRHEYRSSTGIGMNIDGITFLWSEHYRR